MRRRIKYMVLDWVIPDTQRQEVLNPCGHCTARLYLEGRAVHDGGPALALAPRRPTPPDNHPRATDAAATASAAPAAKRPRIAQECLQELKDLKQLLDAGVLNAEEFAELKARLLRGD